MNSDQTYRVSQHDNAFCVIAPSGRTLITSPSAPTAEHYADLLNKAYQNGYKAGFKAAKQAAD